MDAQLYGFWEISWLKKSLKRKKDSQFFFVSRNVFKKGGFC